MHRKSNFTLISYFYSYLQFLSVLDGHSLSALTVAPISQFLTRHFLTMFSDLNPIPTFPKYRGPFKVGTAEYEIPTSEIPSSSRVPDPDISTIKFRTFYPASPSEKKNWSASWLPEPQREWLDAHFSFLNAPPHISKCIS